jgi:YD repeat-containing protein
LALAAGLIGQALCAAVEADELGELLVLRDATGAPAYVADSAGREIEFIYDASGALIATIDETGAVTDWQQIFAEIAEACEADGCG